MGGNAKEQEGLQYILGEAVKNYSKDYGSWDSARERFVAGNRSRSLEEYSEWFTDRGKPNSRPIKD